MQPGMPYFFYGVLVLAKGNCRAHRPRGEVSAVMISVRPAWRYSVEARLAAGGA
jgi:hypothetical protein